MKKVIMIGALFALFMQADVVAQDKELSFKETVKKHAKAVFEKNNTVFTNQRLLEVQIKRQAAQHLLDSFVPEQKEKYQKTMQEYLALQLKKQSLIEQNVKNSTYNHLAGLKPVFNEINSMEADNEKILGQIIAKKETLEKDAIMTAYLNPKKLSIILAATRLELEIKKEALKEMREATDDTVKKTILSSLIMVKITAISSLSVLLKVLAGVDKVSQAMLDQFNEVINKISTFNF